MFKGLSEVSPAIIVVYRGHRHLYVNPAAISIYGYSKEELLSMDILALFHPDDREIMWKRMEDRLADREQPRRYELRVITKAGELKWLDTSAHKITYDGEPASIVIAMDITERKMTEEALKESETRYRSIVETAQEGVMLSDLSGRIIFANKRMTNLLGYSMSEGPPPRGRGSTAHPLMILVPAHRGHRQGKCHGLTAEHCAIAGRAGTPHSILNCGKRGERDQTKLFAQK